MEQRYRFGSHSKILEESPAGIGLIHPYLVVGQAKYRYGNNSLSNVVVWDGTCSGRLLLELIATTCEQKSSSYVGFRHKNA